jgi:PAS domain S-box-containing protein
MPEKTKTDHAREAEVLSARLAQRESELAELRRMLQDRQETCYSLDSEECRPNPRHSASLLRLLMDSLPVHISYITADLHYVWVNHHYEHFFGRPRDQIVGRHIREVLGNDALEPRLPHIRRVLAGERVHYEHTLIAPDGGNHHMDTTYIPHFDDRGGVVGFFVLVFDNTDHWQAEQKLRESEARFRQLAENIQEVFWLTSASGGKVLYVSPAYEKIWGRPAASLYREPLAWLEAIHHEDRERVRAHFTADTLVHGQFDAEYRVVRPDGSVRWIHDRGFPVRDDSGRVECIAGLAEDISGIKQAADRERQLLADLAHMARLTTMGEMASGLAHELNQPLAAIMSYIEASMQMLRARGQATADILGAMDGAAAEAERAGKIIHRTKNFLRRTEPHQTSLDLNHLVQEALALAARDIRLGNARLQLDLAQELPPVLADRVQIEQVVLNLVRNALDAMQDTPADQRALTVQTGRTSDGWIETVVSDTGCGLAPETTGQLFQPFYTTKPDGMGMGLAISRTILAAHGGRLEAIPQSGRGATFRFALPPDEKGKRS